MVVSTKTVAVALTALNDTATETNDSTRAIYVIEAVLDISCDIPNDVVLLVQDAMADTAEEDALSQAQYVAETIVEASENYVQYSVIPTGDQILERMRS